MVGTLIGVQLLILTVWEATDSSIITLHPESVFELEFEPRCYCTKWKTWIALEITYFMCVALWGLYVVYETW